MLDRYAVVDDIGTVVNPLLARGQVQGGVAQGAGQALIEDIIYDRDSGQLKTVSLMDYGIPRADNLPAIAVDFSPVPSLSNPLGIKGVGEGGTVAATPTVMNAIIDALAPLGIADVPMPATPERVWRAIRERRPQWRRRPWRKAGPQNCLAAPSAPRHIRKLPDDLQARIERPLLPLAQIAPAHPGLIGEIVLR